MPSAPTTFSTSWGGGSGHYNNDLNWTNGAPSAVCDASITAPGTYTVTMNAGSLAKSMTIGGAGSNPTLQISAENANTNLQVAAGGFLNIAGGASLTLLCNVPPENCGAPNVSAPTIANAGTFTVDATVDGTPFISGQLTNTGAMQFNHTAKFDNGAVTNQGTFNIASGVTVLSGGSSCGDTGVSFKNDTGGTLNATGTGTFDVINYEQGAGSTSGTNPVQKPCGTLKYTGNGASTVTAYGGFSLTGAMQAGQSLTVTNNSANTNAVLGGNFTNNGTITLTCPSSPCGGPGFSIGGNTFTNAGIFTVAAPVTTAGSVSGNLTNTGTMQFDGPARFDNGPVTNQGTFNIASGVTVLSSGSSCGDTGVSFKNDTGGTLNATGSGTFSVLNYEQGNGTTSGTAPVQIPCGSVKYTGNGASKVQANGGFTLTGEMQPGQDLILNETSATLNGNFTNKGSITFTCLVVGCSGGSGSGAVLNAAGNVFTNAGSLTFAAASGTGSRVESGGGGGNVVNTGTIQVDQTGYLSGLVTNQGEINIADGKTGISTTGHCGDSGPRVINASGGEINSVGTGTLSAVNFEQGAGTTSGPTPVSMNCGALKYIGSGASKVLIPNGNSASLTGNLASGQTVTVAGVLHSPSFTNAGTIAFDPNGTHRTLNVNTTLTNTGRVTGVGTVNGSLDNTTGTVAPGASPGTLTVNNAYTQGAAGTLEIEVEGTGADQFDKLAVGGNVTLGGTLALKPSAAYVASAAAGDSVAFLTYGGTRTAVFAQTTVNPALACPKKFSAAYNDGPKNVSAVFSNSGSCPKPPEPPVDPPQPPASSPSVTPPVLMIPNTVLGSHPRGTVKTRKAKATVKFSFSSDQPGASFQCKLDKEAFKPCSSPKAYKAKPGKHTFTVQAVLAGTVDPTPASFSFKVVKLPKKK